MLLVLSTMQSWRSTSQSPLSRPFERKVMARKQNAELDSLVWPPELRQSLHPRQPLAPLPEEQPPFLKRPSGFWAAV